MLWSTHRPRYPDDFWELLVCNFVCYFTCSKCMLFNCHSLVVGTGALPACDATVCVDLSDWLSARWGGQPNAWQSSRCPSDDYTYTAWTSSEYSIGRACFCTHFSTWAARALTARLPPGTPESVWRPRLFDVREKCCILQLHLLKLFHIRWQWFHTMHVSLCATLSWQWFHIMRIKMSSGHPSLLET